MAAVRSDQGEGVMSLKRSVLWFVVALTGVAAMASARQGGSGMGVKQSVFGKLSDGQQVDAYTLTNAKGMSAKIITYGAIVTELHVPDRNGKTADVVLGFDTSSDYLAGHPYFGAIAGRVANRIAKGKFTLDGKEYTLAVNNGPNHLHGGVKGFDKQVWKARGRSPARRARRSSSPTPAPTARRAIPGRSTSRVTYTLTDDNALRIDYTRHHRQGDAGQPHQPQLLQPGRPRRGHDPRPRADDRRRPLHARRRDA